MNFMATVRFEEDAASVFLMFEEQEDVEAARREADGAGRLSAAFRVVVPYKHPPATRGAPWPFPLFLGIRASAAAAN